MQTAKRNLAFVTQVPPGRFDFRLETRDVDVATGEGAQRLGTGQFGSLCSTTGYAGPYKSNRTSQSVSARTADLSAASIQGISIDHHRRQVFVTQRFLNRADVIAILQQIWPMESHRITNAIISLP